AELAEALRRRVPGVEVEIVNFDWNGRPPIAGQVALMADTDVLVGMHGAGLVHTLWLPPWAVVFEIYNCGEASTYRDLARLMGVGYLTGKESDAVRHAPEVPVGVSPSICDASSLQSKCPSQRSRRG
ncbi:MAG: glycosyltransferase family 61 protein, partial [bacterium]|nr:glycosyltransferase family 61 protein [bacterium]